MAQSAKSSTAKWGLAGLAVCVVAAALAVTQDRWLPIVSRASRLSQPVQTGDPVDPHAEHDHASDPAHDHAGHNEATSIQLDAKARKNIGLRTGVVKPQNFRRTVTVPAMVVERPGRSQAEITAPMTGTITRINRLPGQAVAPGDSLFEIRLTHEDLVTAQRDFLRSAEQLDVVRREVARLESVTEGAIAGRRILEQQYEQQKIEAALRAQRQGLLLHGLSTEEIDKILETRELVNSMTVRAPRFGDDHRHRGDEQLYHMQTVEVKRGEHVKAGDTLGVLADHCWLYVEGHAFEDDAERLIAATHGDATVEVTTTAPGGRDDTSLQLNVLYVADQVDPVSRALRFYLGLPNDLVRDDAEGERRFVAWRFRPGQRMQVQIPIGPAWEDQIVLPPGAVVEEGAESFVFEQNGQHFDRVSVHVLYRDKDAVVVANDGSLVGSTLATSSAYQLNLAVKNKSGAAVDPHAGHNH